jgi:excisionase family DNA binding protein
MTFPETVAALRSSRSTIGRLAKSGALPSVRIGRRVLFRASDVTKLATPAAAND